MKHQKLFHLLIYLFFLNLSAQIDSTSKLLAGNWKFIKAVNLKGEKIEYINTGYDTQSSISSPNIILKIDNTFRYTDSINNFSKGTWKLKSKTKIIFKFII